MAIVHGAWAATEAGEGGRGEGGRGEGGRGVAEGEWPGGCFKSFNRNMKNRIHSLNARCQAIQGIHEMQRGPFARAGEDGCRQVHPHPGNHHGTTR